MRSALLGLVLLLSAPAAADDPDLYVNPALGYRIRRPAGDWALVRTPPFPLTDVVLYSTADDAHLAVAVDRAPDPGISPEGTALALEAWRRTVEVSYRDLDETHGDYEPLDDHPAWSFSTAATDRLDGTRWRLARRAVHARGLAWLVDTRRPESAAPRTARALEAALASFEFYDPAERDGDLFSPAGWFVSLTVPAGWTSEETRAGDRLEVRLDGGPSGRFALDVVRRKTGPLEKAEAERLLRERLAGAVPAGPVAALNEKGLVAYSIACRSGPAEVRLWAFARERRLFLARAEGAGRSVYDGLAVHADVSIDLDAEREAEADDLEGRRLFHEGRLERAAIAFARALEHFPRDATARNHLGLAALEGHRWDDAIRDFSAARALFPVSCPIQVNLGRARLMAGHARLAEVPPDLGGARRHFEDAAETAGRFREPLAAETAIAWNALGLAEMEKDRFTQAAADLERALEFDDEPVFRENLAAVYFNEACELAARGNLPRARTRLEEAIRLKPDFPEARDALRRIQGR